MTKSATRCLLGFLIGLVLVCQGTPFAIEASFEERRVLSGRLDSWAYSDYRMNSFDLDRIIQPITTVTQFPDGKKELNVGSGFIVGRRYFTVYHNLTSFTTSPSARKTIYLDGIPMMPSYTQVEKDIAVFDLPDALCAKYCNHVSFGKMPPLERDRKVYWLRKFNGEMALKEGRVLNYAFIGDVPGSADAYSLASCNVNLIVEVDTPFLAGSSGAPVLDATTGQIIGIIQGSMESAGIRSGYFKPIHCVTSLLSQQPL